METSAFIATPSAHCGVMTSELEAHVRDLFRVLSFWPDHRLVEVAPHRWRATKARLDHYELELGPLTVPSEL